MEQALGVAGSQLCPGSTVNVRWMGAWYDGTVLKLGPQRHLYKVADVAGEHEILVEPKQLKLLDSKFAHSSNMKYAFNDGDSWIQVQIIEKEATGAAKVSWRKDVYSSEMESWFEKADVSLVDRSETHVLQAASKSGLLPVKGIEEHPRTVENAVYQSESESEEDSVFGSNMGITVHTEPSPHHAKSTPAHSHSPHPLTPHHRHSLTPHHRHSLTPQHWNHPHNGFTRMRMMSDSLVPRVAPAPPKNIAQSSMPCVWSYGSQCTSGIAPHYTSNFFHRLRLRKQSNKKSTSGKHQETHYRNGFTRPNRHFREQANEKNESDLEDELGQRHMIYDQFVLNRDPRLDERKVPVKASRKLQYQSPEVISSSPETITAKSGESVQLTCTTAGTQPIQYKWLKDGTKIKGTKVKYPGPGILELIGVSPNESGSYSCVISNEYGSITRNFKLTVLQGIKLSLSQTIRNLEDEILATDAKLEEDVTGKKEVQNFLNAIVDEIRVSDSDDELALEDHDSTPPAKNSEHLTVPNPGPSPSGGHSSSMLIPRISVTTAFNNEMEQYLFGYGEDYGGPSAVNLLPAPTQTSKKDHASEDMNSVEVHTSLGSSDNHSDESTVSADAMLPTEKESVLDQVQRLQASIQLHDPPTSQVQKKRWYNRIFSSKK